MKPSALFLIAFALACGPSSKPQAVGAWYLDSAEGCGFIRANTTVQPTALVNEYLSKDAEGDFNSANAWLDTSLVCAGHLPGWDAGVVATEYRARLLDSTADSVRIAVTYQVAGTVWSDGHYRPADTLEVVTFVVVPTPWGWRIDGPQLIQHNRPEVYLRDFPLSRKDSLAIAQLKPMAP